MQQHSGMGERPIHNKFLGGFAIVVGGVWPTLVCQLHANSLNWHVGRCFLPMFAKACQNTYQCHPKSELAYQQNAQAQIGMPIYGSTKRLHLHLKGILHGVLSASKSEDGAQIEVVTPGFRCKQPLGPLLVP